MIVIGADLGQAQDPTALAVAEVHPPEFHVRHLERLPLGMPYPRVVERIADLFDKLPDATLVVDATGVGRAVLDQMREAGLEPVPVTITGGRHTSFDGLHWRVPKQALLRPLVAATEAGRLKVARGTYRKQMPSCASCRPSRDGLQKAGTLPLKAWASMMI